MKCAQTLVLYSSVDRTNLPQSRAKCIIVVAAKTTARKYSPRTLRQRSATSFCQLFEKNSRYGRRWNTGRVRTTVLSQNSEGPSRAAIYNTGAIRTHTTCKNDRLS